MLGLLDTSEKVEGRRNERNNLGMLCVKSEDRERQRSAILLTTTEQKWEKG